MTKYAKWYYRRIALLILFITACCLWRYAVMAGWRGSRSRVVVREFKIVNPRDYPVSLKYLGPDVFDDSYRWINIVSNSLMRMREDGFIPTGVSMEIYCTQNSPYQFGCSSLTLKIESPGVEPRSFTIEVPDRRITCAIFMGTEDDWRLLIETRDKKPLSSYSQLARADVRMIHPSGRIETICRGVLEDADGRSLALVRRGGYHNDRLSYSHHLVDIRKREIKTIAYVLDLSRDRWSGYIGPNMQGLFSQDYKSVMFRSPSCLLPNANNLVFSLDMAYLIEEDVMCGLTNVGTFDQLPELPLGVQTNTSKRSKKTSEKTPSEFIFITEPIPSCKVVVKRKSQRTRTSGASLE